MPTTRDHAIVLGASMAGLLTARQLSDHFARVTIVERDTLPADIATRKGVPQGAHAHGVLTSGYRVMDRYFPGMFTALEAAGCPVGDVTGRFLWHQYGAYKSRDDVGLEGICVSRPALESAVRERVCALPNVTLLEAHDAEHPVFDAASGRVTGQAVKDRGTGESRIVPADLVVDATGRGSQAPKLLESWGFGAPPVTTVKVDVGYATRVFERRSGDMGGYAGIVVAADAPRSRRVGVAIATEGDRWVVTLAGILGDHPPTDDAGWLDFAASLPTADILDIAKSRPPLVPIASYRYPANQRRHYEQMKRFPAGFLVLGDGFCSFNPIYGQGMSSAALQTVALGEALRSGDDAGLAARYFRRAAKVVDMPWMIATGEDFRYPEVEGKRPPMAGLVRGYLERVHRAAATDPVVNRKFFEVLTLLAPPQSLMTPRLMARVLLKRPAPATAPAPLAEPVVGPMP
jgi:2-polyprenyl-6-methoxyphenol hydroxylase-like FAD-dependent oxidoreductase